MKITQKMANVIEETMGHLTIDKNMTAGDVAIQIFTVLEQATDYERKVSPAEPDTASITAGDRTVTFCLETETDSAGDFEIIGYTYLAKIQGEETENDGADISQFYDLEGMIEGLILDILAQLEV